MTLTRRTFLTMSSAAAVQLRMNGSAAVLQYKPATAYSRILDPGSQFRRFAFWQNRDWAWYEAMIPLFESPEPQIDRTYYYRWELITRHLRYTSPEYGYIATEFLASDEVTWAGRYQAISGAADLHLDDLRWMKHHRAATDYLRYFLTVPGAKPRAYGFAPTWAGAMLSKVYGGRNAIADLLPQSIANYQGWEAGRVAYPNDNGFSPAMGLFWNTGRDMGSEMNLASAQLSESLNGIAGYKIRGGAGFRPDINAVMYAEAVSIADLARANGDKSAEVEYRAKAVALKRNVQTKLWDPAREFFMHRWRYNEYADGDTAGRPSIKAGSMLWESNLKREGGVGFDPSKPGAGHGREIFCYHLWRYALPDDNDEGDATNGYARAWKFLTSPDYFAGKFGPRTAEVGDPWYSVIYGECRHNGQSWPYHTARVLAGGSVLLNDYRHHQHFSREDWMRFFRQYAAMHELAGRPYLAESHDPDRPQWTELRPIGYHYFHSSFIDHVVTGVVGLRPRSDEIVEVNPLCPQKWDYFAVDDLNYHGHRLQIVWDRSGERYGRGRGLQVIADGRVIARSDTLTRLIGTLPREDPPHMQPASEANYAVNAEHLASPIAVASVANPIEHAELAINGNCWYDPIPVNRWTSRGSKNPSEWFEVRFEKPTTIHRVTACFYEDELGIQAPQAIVLDKWYGGQWKSVSISKMPTLLRAHCATQVYFKALITERLRLTMSTQHGCGVGLAAFEAWGPAGQNQA